MKGMVETDLVGGKQVIQTQNILWKLSVFEDHHKSTSAALELMTSILQKHELREVADMSWAQTSSSKKEISNSVEKESFKTRREKLLYWLLMSLGKENVSLRSGKSIQKSVAPAQAVEAILALIRPGYSAACIESCSKEAEEDSLLSSEYLGCLPISTFAD